MNDARTIGWQRFTMLALGAIFCLNVYRAATQSITIDEAFTWNHFASQPFAGYLQPYDANNHVLNSILIRLCVSLFGLSEFTMRLPSLLAGGLYLVAAYRISRLLCGGGVWSAMTAILLATDPLLLDFLSAARGYGALLAFWLAAVYLLIRVLDLPETGAGDHPEAKLLFGAGILSGLAIASNLTAIFPVTATALAFLWAKKPGLRDELSCFWTQYAVPAILIPAIVMTVPLSKASPENFYVGADSLAVTFLALVDTAWGAYSSVRTIAEVGGAILITAAALCIRSAWRPLRFVSLLLPLLLILALASHWLAGLRYPITRTSLYFIPATILTAAIILWRCRTRLFVPAVAALAGGACLLGFVLQFRVSYYAEWQFDAGTKTIASYIRSHYDVNRPLTIRSSWQLEPSLNFYRTLWSTNWVPLDRTPLDKGSGEVWVIVPGFDPHIIEQRRLKQIFREPRTGNIIAVTDGNAALPGGH